MLRPQPVKNVPLQGHRECNQLLRVGIRCPAYIVVFDRVALGTASVQGNPRPAVVPPQESTAAPAEYDNVPGSRPADSPEHGARSYRA